MKRFTLLAAAALSALMALAQHPSPSSKLSPHLRRLVTQTDAAASAQSRRNAPSEPHRLSALVRFAPSADVAALAGRYGFLVERTVGDISIVTVAVDSIVPLAADARTLRIEAEPTARKMLDVVPSQIGSDKAAEGQQLPQAFTGEGVVVGIVDAGLDYTHPMFKDAAGNTRIVFAGDYLSQPNRLLTDPQEILAARYSPDPYEYHGTHVAGIAVGSRVTRTFDDKAFQGIAPGADIAFGAINLTGDNPIINAADPTSADAMKAFIDIFAEADKAGKPCVINFSAGISQTMATNRQLEEELITTLASKPGHAVVVASGNQGWYRYLAHKEANATVGGAGVMFHKDDAFGRYFGVELRVQPSQTITIDYTDAAYTTSHGKTSFSVAELTAADGGTLSRVIGQSIYRRTVTASFSEQLADGSVVLFIGDNATYPETDRMVVSVEGEGEAWIYADTSFAPLEDVASRDGHQITVDGYSVAWPASMDAVITVGNIGWRYVVYGTYGVGMDQTAYEMGKGEGYLARSSSVGPTLDGRIKPDVCAPGVNVISALSNGLGYGLGYETQTSLDQQLQYEYMGFIDEEGSDYHMLLVQTGTSMAAPAVAGTVALWMQADPTLTTSRIRDVIAHSSRQPDSDLQYPNSQYGHGEIDAYRGLCYLLGVNAIAEVSRDQPRDVRFRLDGSVLTADGAGAATITVYSLDGRVVARATATSTISLAHLPRGIYAVQVDTADSNTTGSTLIRL